MSPHPPDDASTPPSPRPLPSTTIPHSEIHLRPAQLSDLAQCWAIHSHWVLYAVASMQCVPHTFGEFKETTFTACANGMLPFVVAVYRPGQASPSPDLGAGAAEGYNASGCIVSDGRNCGMEHHTGSTKDSGEIRSQHSLIHEVDVDELILGYCNLAPNFQDIGYRIQMVGQNTWVHPSLRVSGIGTRFSALVLNLAKAPERYTLIPPPKTPYSPANPPRHPELDPATYHEFRGVPLRPVKTMMRRNMVDEDGIGKGKGRFFEKIGFRECGYVAKAGVKWGKTYDMRYYTLDLEEWDEVESRLREKGKEGEKANL